MPQVQFECTIHARCAGTVSHDSRPSSQKCGKYIKEDVKREHLVALLKHVDSSLKISAFAKSTQSASKDVKREHLVAVLKHVDSSLKISEVAKSEQY
jgi:hypothetical protein